MAQSHSDLEVKTGHQLVTIEYAARKAAYDGQFDVVEKLYHKDRVLNSYSILIFHIVDGALSAGYLNDAANAMHTLLSIKDPQLRDRFAKEADRRAVLAFNLSAFVADANILATQSQAKDFTFEQRVAFFTPEIQLLIDCSHTGEHLPGDVWLLVAAFLFPSLLKENELKSSFDKLLLQSRQIELNLELKTNYLSSSKHALFRYQKPQKFALTCLHANSNKALDDLLTHEETSSKKKLSNKNPLKNNPLRENQKTSYVRVIERHARSAKKS